MSIPKMFFNMNHKLFILTLFFPIYLLPFAFSGPIPDSPLDRFINSLIEDKCIMPKDLKLPFPESTDPNAPPFSYLSSPLDECRKTDALKPYNEAKILCTEIFDVLKNITCAKFNHSLSTIESEHISEDVCHDFENLKGSLPKKENYLSGRLTDEFICKVLCSAEKYEQLCKILFWSYDTLLKIKKSLSSEEQENGNEAIAVVSPDTANSSVKQSSSNDVSETIPQNMKKPNKPKASDDLNTDEESNLNQVSQKAQNVANVIGEGTSQNISVKKVSPNPQTEGVAINKTLNAAKDIDSVIQNKAETKNKKVVPDTSENSITPTESKNPTSLRTKVESIDDNENKIDTGEEPPLKEVKDNNPQENLNKNNLTASVSGIKDNPSIKNETASQLLTTENVDSKQVKTVSKNISNPNEKSVEPVNPATENDNELKNDNFPDEEDKSKVKQTNLEKQESKEAEKPKETDYEGADEVLPENDSKLPEPSTQSILPDEDIEHQEDKDQYNDNENDGDYAKSEYENSLNLPSKIKEPEMKSSVGFGSSQMTNGYAGNMNPKDNINRISEEIAVIAPFPEQEDSHFFFYFLSIVLIIMAGYLIFHNKQKIIALIVEGRHERRRRSGVGYKKLETK